MAAQTQRPPNLTNFVVIGEGLAAGFANFSLHQVHQEKSFPSLMARQMGVGNFPQPLFQAPGLGNVPGFPGLPPRVPGNLQETVRVPGGPKPTDRRTMAGFFASLGETVPDRNALLRPFFGGETMLQFAR
ncbi:MAG: hypothetical protein IPM24_15300 [Bryobacterales bacterium]|nr:hypothetical protein [Bryobacterales bacterium]